MNIHCTWQIKILIEIYKQGIWWLDKVYKIAFWAVALKVSSIQRKVL